MLLDANKAKVELTYGGLTYDVIPAVMTLDFVSDMVINTQTLEDNNRSFMRGGHDEISIQGRIKSARKIGYLPKIQEVIFNPPATIVLWEDGTKTVVKAQDDVEINQEGKLKLNFRFVPEPYDPEKGLAMAIAKKALGNKGNYYNEFKKWLKESE